MELPQEGMDLRETIHALEKNLITQALERHGGNKTKACAALGLNRTTLIEKMRRFGMDLNVVLMKGDKKQ